MGLKENILAKIRGYKTVEQLERLGFTHGKNFKMMFGVVIDWGICHTFSTRDSTPQRRTSLLRCLPLRRAGALGLTHSHNAK